MVDLAILRTKVMFIVRMMILLQIVSTLKIGQSIIIKEGEGRGVHKRQLQLVGGKLLNCSK